MTYENPELELIEINPEDIATSISNDIPDNNTQG